MEPLYFNTSYPPYAPHPSFPAPISHPHALQPPPPHASSSHHQQGAVHALEAIQQLSSQPPDHINGFSHHVDEARGGPEGDSDLDEAEQGQEGEGDRPEQTEEDYFAAPASSSALHPQATRTSGRARRPSRRSALADGTAYLDGDEDEEEISMVQQHFGGPAEHEDYAAEEYGAPIGEFENVDVGVANGQEMTGDEHEPLYVNAKQYHRIMKRRAARARLEEMGRLSRQRKVSGIRPRCKGVSFAHFPHPPLRCLLYFVIHPSRFARPALPPRISA